MLKLVHWMAAWPHQVWLEITRSQMGEAIARHQNYSNDVARRNAYISDLCLTTILAWLNNEDSLPGALSSLGDATVWEFLPGAVIQVGGMKLALIPSEIGADQFSVPFEWLNIPDWAANYYLAVQMNLEDDEPWLRIWGFASQQQLKSGPIDLKKRLYKLDRTDLTENLNVLWAMGANAESDVLSQIKPLPKLTLDRLEALLAELGKPTDYSPRLEVPFEEWAVVLANPNWRKMLCDRRQKSPELKQSSTHLHNWIKRMYTAVEDGWQTVEAIVSPPRAIPARGGALPISTPAEIAPILRLVQSTESEQIRQQAAGVLGEIGANHPDTVDILVELLQTAQKEETRWQAALSLGKIAPHHPLAGIRRARLIDLGLQLGPTAVALVVAIMPKPNDRIGVFLQIQSIDPSLNLPPDLKISVQSNAGETQLSTLSRGKDKSIELRFTPPSGTRFQVQIALNQFQITEEFST
jgi:Protein of unknown function (DUF1822)